MPGILTRLRKRVLRLARCCSCCRSSSVHASATKTSCKPPKSTTLTFKSSASMQNSNQSSTVLASLIVSQNYILPEVEESTIFVNTWALNAVRKDNNMANTQKDVTDDSIKTIKDKVENAADDSIATIDDQIENTESKDNGTDDSIETIEDKVDVTKSKDDDIDDSIETIDNIDETTESKDDDTDDSIETIEDKVDVSESKDDDTDDSIETIEDKVDVTESKDDDTDDSIETIEDKVDVTESKDDDTDDSIETIDNKVETLESKDEDTDDSIETIEDKVDVTESKDDDTDDSIETIDNKVETLESKDVDTNDSIETIEHKDESTKFKENNTDDSTKIPEDSTKISENKVEKADCITAKVSKDSTEVPDETTDVETAAGIAASYEIDKDIQRTPEQNRKTRELFEEKKNKIPLTHLVGRYNQWSIRGKYSGSQCTATAFTAVTFHQTTAMPKWTAETMEYVVYFGDYHHTLFRDELQLSNNPDNRVALDELPSTVRLTFGEAPGLLANVGEMAVLFLSHTVVTREFGHTLKEYLEIETADLTEASYVITITSYSHGIVKDKSGHWFLFDSHGSMCIPPPKFHLEKSCKDGTAGATLTRFNSLDGLVAMLQDNYRAGDQCEARRVILVDPEERSVRHAG